MNKGGFAGDFHNVVKSLEDQDIGIVSCSYTGLGLGLRFRVHPVYKK